MICLSKGQLMDILSFFQFETIKNKVAMNIQVQMF